MISILCGVKNRTEHLLQSYKSWLLCEGVGEVVIVDWGSDIPISQTLGHNEKLKIVQVNPNHTKYWSFSQAYNLAARFATSDYLLLMNADEIILDKKEICKLPLPGNVPIPENRQHLLPNHGFYYEGTSWGSKRAQGVYFLYISKDNFWSINGYHEYLIGYGYDDIDLRVRLIKSGLTRKSADVKIEHIKHDYIHASWENYLNAEIAQSRPWKSDDTLIDIDFKTDGNIIYCDINEDYRITDKWLVNRKKRGKILSKRVKDFYKNPEKYEMGHR